MGVPGFYSWLIKRYPLIKHMVGKQSLPQIDYLYLDMNGIIYKCVKDDSVIFKAQIMPKEFEQIWVEVFNYINTIVNLLKPGKMIFLALDGVAPRSKMNNQRARRFKSARDYKEFIQRFYGYNEQNSADSQENFKNNSISPGTKFMEELNEMIHFFIQKKIEEDDYWKNISVIFTGSDCPGEGEHKIMEWIRTNKHQFDANDSHCLYGADADLIMLGLTLPMKNICIIREQYIHSGDKVKIKDSKKQKVIQFQMIFLSILRQYFDMQYEQIKDQLTNLQYSISKIIKDFVFLFFFIGNDFLPRCMAFNIRERSIQKLISAFKQFLISAENYVVGDKEINIKQLARLCNQIAKYQSTFIEEKAEDAQKYLQKKVQFDDEFAQVMSQKVMKESEFLNQLKQFYMNQDQSLRFSFYNTKFGINPSEKVEEFYSILGFYLHGLKFVFEYYFLNLSSWSWYYPYYYAPLLSDVSFYLNYLAESGQKLNELELGQPFEPFKQLLCILPKESCELLPAPFQKYLKDENSPLRSPVDYYPDQFEDDLYGSTRSHEAISLIPFLDQNMIKKVYDQAITQVIPEDLRRNKINHTRLYEYDEKAQQIQVKSPLSVIQSFTCPIRIQSIQLLKQIKWSHSTNKTILNNNNNPNLARMPTLNMKDHQVILEDDKRSTRYLLEITEPEDKTLKLGNHIYYGFPLEHSGRIEAILTRDSLQYSPDFRPENYALGDISRDYNQLHEIQKRKKELFQDLIDNFRRKQFSYLTLKNVEALAFIIDTQYFNRSLCGAFQRVYTLENDFKTYQIVPLALVSKEKKYQITKSNFKFKSLQQQFPLGEEVLLTHADANLCGNKAKVIGYTDKKVKVRVTHKLKMIKPEKLDKIVNTDEVFFELRFVAEVIKMKPDIALTILDTVSIELPRQKNLPEAIDIGLNFISRQDNKIVPNLVRINYSKDYVRNEDPKRIFKHLELSVKAFEMLLEYKKKYPEVLDFITERHHRLVQEAKMKDKPINWRQKMKAEDIYRDDGKSQTKHQQTTKNLMRVYLWLIKNKQTHMPMSSIYSKQISYKKITKLEEYFKTERASKRQAKQAHEEQLLVDPNFLFSIRLARMGYLFLSSRPEDHVIGDQIVCLHPEFFGHFGVVIGIDNDRYEVMFEKPSFGKTDLGGLCSNLWGGKFRFKEILNLDFWPKYFRERAQTKGILQNSGWIDTLKEFYPKFKSNPIRNFNDFELIIKNETIAKYFQASTIEYVQKIRSQLKQIEVDKDYVVVDNVNHDFQFKYDKKQTNVTQKQVEELAKNKKWIEKKTGDFKNQDFEREIIENKLANMTLEDKEVKVEIEKKVEHKETVKVTYKLKEQQPKQITKKPSATSNNNGKKQKYMEKPVQKEQAPVQQQKKQEKVQPESKPSESAEFGQEEDAADILG